MPDIVGTVINLRNFLSNQETPVKVKIGVGDDSAKIFVLKENRKYVIPDFQREIRWEKEQLIELMRDIKSSEKFLGNIILTIKDDGVYEIIDGQQRLTILFLLLHYIKITYSSAIGGFETCGLENQSFKGFNLLMSYNFDYDKMSDDDKQFVSNTDVFKQRKRYQHLWEAIPASGMLDNSDKAKLFIRNLERCSINIIANSDDGTGRGIEYFLDVNLKGVKLDAEDIFKGYLFSNDAGEEVRELWRTLKELGFRLNERFEYYPIMILLKHYLYCDLYNYTEYEGISFEKKNFYLTKEIEINGSVHYVGEHVIKAINNNAYMKNCLKNTNGFLSIIIDIIESGGASRDFKEIFVPEAKMDSTEIEVIHDFIKSIIMDSDEIPKIVVMKYIFTVLMNPLSNKSDYRKIYGVYFLWAMFILFDSKRGGDQIYEIVKSSDWYEKIISRIRYYFTNNEITERRIIAQCRYAIKEDCDNDYIRCKTLATIYNFFEIREEKVCVKKSAFKDLHTFVKDHNTYSVEHFIVNNGKIIKIIVNGIEDEFSYPAKVKKYANSIFDFIFIPEKLNNHMDCMHVVDKIKYMDKCKIDIQCDYSKLVYEVAKDTFDSYPNFSVCSNAEDAKILLKHYYEDEFISSYSIYAKEIVSKLVEHFKTTM